MSDVTQRDMADLRERLARIEEKVSHTNAAVQPLIARVEAVERWKLKLVSITAAVTTALTFFASEIKARLFS